MRRPMILLVAVALAAAACGGDDDTTTEAVATDNGGTETASPAAIVIEEIDFVGDRIVLRNTGDAPYDLTGHWICNRPSYAELPAEVIAPGATFEVAASTVGLDAGSGELAVYTQREFDSADAIVRYVAWGAAGQGRQGTATEAGLWGADDFVDNQGSGLVSSGDDPVGSGDWSTG